MSELSQLPLLPLTAKQRGMIGETRAKEAQKAQLHARGVQVLASDPKPLKRVSFFPSAACQDPNVSSSCWSSAAVSEVFAGTTRTGNHVCRPDVCHKGRIGKKGFCRMYYWHWCRGKDKHDKDIAKMSH
eukprot:2806376-Karenia_brevis.AAC.1